jgi:hypothetical protein
MTDLNVVVWILQIMVVLLAVSLGKSILVYKIRQEENRKRQLELSMFDRRAKVLEDGKKNVVNLEDMLYKAQLQKEIDDIIRKSGTR